jgi:hypothetical protein
MPNETKGVRLYNLPSARRPPVGTMLIRRGVGTAFLWGR